LHTEQIGGRDEVLSSCTLCIVSKNVDKSPPSSRRTPDEEKLAEVLRIYPSLLKNILLLF
jgi:hypothetical protein